ncbi:hypothetical protein TREMEDRAFT_30858 [Tremella mesenterica DSM 1558]|uniref:uncharacterized protein n=1 Tax=Tremella mesenterica (strain ATCC 24925 / CBS 8224 / DSM 1558 / NBRC 9311 / NRRL Y-6157 / RJB 2259-6 / UBC 559-6) TaxID=578456 RepID=UPI0003F48CB5|nr:uncharacterized protein TREMEDRAFT_30858 [Tremella mesenterica DSM 1558]EIW69326.1 hypothetical protein TREMEDRAFT_30858 [Tremella mesenterica DSM 1558]
MSFYLFPRIIILLLGIILYLPTSQAAANPFNAHSTLLRRSVTTDPNSAQGKSFDFVIAGGGLAGLAIATRLSEWDNVTVLVVEAGMDGSQVADQIQTPGYSYLKSLTGSAYDWAYTTVAQTDSLGLTKYWPRGKVLGGSGAINGMFWGRGSVEDYDAWSTLNPNAAETWNWEEMSKYINKAENFSTPNASVQETFGMQLNTSAHGSGGPIQTGFSEYIYSAVANWIPSWKNLGFTAMDLWNGNVNGVMICPSTINMHNETRSDSYYGYIQPLPPRSNLVILTGFQVTQVIFNGTSDSNGNKYASGLKFKASATDTEYAVQANKEVILAGGTVGSPQILQLSGIGPASLLQSLNINVVVDLPVGYNLQDHVSYSMYWSVPSGTNTWGTLANSDTLKASALTEYQTSDTGLWTFINEAVGYVSMSDITSTQNASDYASNVQSQMSTLLSDMTSWQDLPNNVVTGLQAQYALQHGYLTSNNGQLEVILTMLGPNLAADQVGIQVALQHPWSRGKIMITSNDPFTKPSIDPNYFGVGYDIDILNYGSQFARKLASTAPLNTVTITETLPGATVVGDALSNYTKQNCGTEYHPLGTCSMLPKDSGGVVDTTLTVYGTNNLRVMDASIMPLQISAHLMASTYGIAEKGSDIIKNRWMKVLVTNTTSNATTTSDTATAGTATDTSVTKAGDSNASKGISTGGKIAIGVCAGLAALAILGVLVSRVILLFLVINLVARRPFLPKSPLGRSLLSLITRPFTFCLVL